MKKNLICLLCMLLFVAAKTQTLSDIDGNVYNTINIGTQTWMKENLRTTRFNDGTPIATTTVATNNDTSAVYRWTYNDDPLNMNVFGGLYTWFVVDNTKNVCPLGWHVPDESEWITLGNFLGGAAIAGNKMKETGTTTWSVTSTMVTNSSLFTGLPGGFRGNPSGFNRKNTSGSFWSSTPWGSNIFPRAYTFNLKCDTSSLDQAVAVGNCGLSLRCIQDIGTGIKNKTASVKISIFPNPAHDKLNVYAEENKEFQIFIYDTSGRIFFEKLMRGKTNSIDIGFLPGGVYVVKILNETGSFEQKLIKN